MVRGWARGWRVGVVQFMKSGKWKTGERKLAEHLGIEWQTLGDGFTWESTDLDETAAKNGTPGRSPRAKLASGDYDLLILDELTYVVNYGWVPVARVVAGIEARWPKTNVVITGRDAPPELDRDGRHGHRDAQGQARLRAGHQGPEGDRVLITAQLHSRIEQGEELPLLVWRLAAPRLVASTGSCGGGLGARSWVINAQVASDYARIDIERHGAELAALAELSGAGVVLFTAANVRGVRQAEDGGVQVDATVGLTHPTWAADATDEPVAPVAGTINIVAQLPVRLSDAALLNALCTATEAKTQALFAAGVPGTGTASDAMTVICPADGPVEPFAGPRSTWGARLARAVHDAVAAGAVVRP